ncbi:MAG: MATE family efflux transporter [Lachnospiraceae bacterium]|nr:MATE family efflux transporter [Lachnospiraceae bacterium]
MEKNLTTGSVFRTIIQFSLPYLLSYFLQTLYGMADLFIIGQFAEVDSITAVSVGSQVMHMITVVIVGLAMGTTVLVGRAIGAGRRKEASAVIGNTVTLFLGLSVVLTLLLLAVREPLVALMATPGEAVSGTVFYLTICFLGIPFITAYNIISSVFRGLGDSKSPMYFVALACGANIALDYLFIGGLGLEAAGAALGTVLAQTFSVAVSLLMIRRRKAGPQLSAADMRPRKATMGSLFKIGVPVALQDGCIQVAFIVITVIANKRGLNDAAAVGIVEKIIGILFLVPSSMLSAVSALSAQNIGAGKQDRARQTLWYATAIAVVFGITVSVAVQFAAEQVVGLFSSDPGVILPGGQYLRSYVWDCAFAGIHFCFSGYFCACGKSLLSFLHNIASIICVRIPVAYFASVYYPDTLFPMGIASPAGSMLSALICVAAYLWMERKGTNT